MAIARNSIHEFNPIYASPRWHALAALHVNKSYPKMVIWPRDWSPFRVFQAILGEIIQFDERGANIPRHAECDTPVGMSVRTPRGGLVSHSFIMIITSMGSLFYTYGKVGLEECGNCHLP